MKRILLYFPLLFLFACTEGFEAINTNENAPSEVQPELLLRQVIYGYGDDMAYESFVAGNLLSQHFSMIDFNLFDRHALASPQEGGNPWPVLYTALRDNETILNLSRENPAQAVYEGPALVMKAYLTMTLTDLFGDVPYSEAFRGRTSGITTPRYDRQQDIYLAEGGIIDNLRMAVEIMDAYSGAQSLRGDILFDGDLEGWIRLANSLRIKALIRISERAEPGGQIQQIFDEGRYIAAPDDDATFAFTAGQPNNYPLATARIGIFNVFLMSATAEQVFAGLNDARVPVLYRASAAGGEFVGIENGIDASSAITPDNFARPGLIWRENSGGLPFNIMTSWETDFLLAEAAAKGLLNVEAEEWYRRAVDKAFRYWNTERPAGYFNGAAAFNQDNPLESIITQKWIASIGNSYEAWVEYRRTGYPVAIRPAAASLNNGLFPVRLPYPSEEQALNFENLQSAAAATDDNSVNARVWWDVE